MANDFATVMVDDYASAGFAEKINDLSLRSLDGSTTVELEAVEENGEVKGLALYANAVLVDQYFYSDENFGQNFATEMLALLDA